MQSYEVPYSFLGLTVPRMYQKQKDSMIIFIKAMQKEQIKVIKQSKVK